MRAAIRGIVHGGSHELARRTLRALAALGIPSERCAGDDAALARALWEAPGPAWVVRAGAWPVAFAAPPPSATGKPLLGLGARREPDEDALAGGWDALLAATGGDLARWPARVDAALDSIWTEAPAALAAQLERGEGLLGAVRALTQRGHRAVRIPALDVRHDERLRVAQALTALHRGGAERIAVELLLGLRAAGDAARLLVMDRPARSAIPAPPGTVLLGDVAPDRAARAEELARLTAELGVDVVHAHLLDAKAIEALAAQGAPVVVTLHNQRQGWPAGLAELPPGACALWAACSLAVREDAIAAGLRGPVRTVWNGVLPPSPERLEALAARGLEIRRSLGIPARAPVLLVVANYRPQKRLEALPSIFTALLEHGVDAHLILAGERERGPAAPVAAALREAVEAHRVGHRVHEVGDQEDVAPYYAASDLLLTISAHEGLSLAQLDALAAGLSLVTTDVGGARELARAHPQVTVVPREAPDHVIAGAMLDALDARRAAAKVSSPRPGLAKSFEAAQMVRRHRDLYRRALAPPAAPGGGIALVTNNFSTGGAQSSARRLLLALKEAGVRVRAAVIQEQAGWPTPGRQALEGAGIPVLAAPSADANDALVTARAVASWIDAEPPAAVLFWNVIPEHKLLLADLLLGVPVFDVSPGEMFFASLTRYFTRPRPGLPYLTARDYGALLAGAVVKYAGEAERAAEALGAPVHVIPNGIPVPAQPPQRAAKRERLVIGTLARIGPDKKLEQLIEAARRAGRAGSGMPPWELRVAGAPERGAEAYAQELRALAEGLPIRWVGEADSGAFLADLDLFALVAEPAGCPNASLEAMAGGLAVAATDVGGVREQVVHGETGLLVPRGDAAALGEALLELGRDEARRRAMGAAGHRRAAAEFSVARMAERYARLCTGRAPGG